MRLLLYVCAMYITYLVAFETTTTSVVRRVFSVWAIMLLATATQNHAISMNQD
jgi:hypothetical protein